MEIRKEKTDGKLTLAPLGRLDTVTSPELEAAIDYDGVNELVFDLAGIDYVSSAGLRVLLSAQKKMAGGKMTIVNACAPVREVFAITGFSDIFTIL